MSENLCSNEIYLNNHIYLKQNISWVFFFFASLHFSSDEANLNPECLFDFELSLLYTMMDWKRIMEISYQGANFFNEENPLNTIGNNAFKIAKRYRTTNSSNYYGVLGRDNCKMSPIEVNNSKKKPFPLRKSTLKNEFKV